VLYIKYSVKRVKKYNNRRKVGDCK